MKKLFLLLFLTFNLFAIEKNVDRSLLDSITKDAIKIGTGKNFTAYVFLDPLCQYSRKFLTKITTDKELQKKKTYYVFLYRLPIFESDKLIDYIYQSKDNLKTIKEVMVEKKPVNLDNFKLDLSTYFKVQAVAKVGKKIGVTRRPYVIGYKKGSIFCDVSSGQASCEAEGEY